MVRRAPRIACAVRTKNGSVIGLSRDRKYPNISASILSIRRSLLDTRPPLVTNIEPLALNFMQEPAD